MPTKTGWDPPFGVLAVLCFVLVLAISFILAGSPGEVVSGVGQNLISELVGFVLTAGAIGVLLNRQSQLARNHQIARRRTILASQSSETDDKLQSLIVGRAEFGPQYMPELRRALLALERLDFDCGELLSTDLYTDLPERLGRFQQKTRELMTALESVQEDLFGRPPAAHPMLLPDATLTLMEDWRVASRALDDK